MGRILYSFIIGTIVGLASVGIVRDNQMENRERAHNRTITNLKTENQNLQILLEEQKRHYDWLLKFQVLEYSRMLAESREDKEKIVLEYQEEIKRESKKYDKLFFSTLEANKLPSSQ